MSAALAAGRSVAGTRPTSGDTTTQARRPARVDSVVRPRLLLPPTAEPPRSVAAADATARPQIRSVLSPITTSSWPVAEVPMAQPEPLLEDPTRLCGAVVMAAVEALVSARPLVQLARWVSPEVYESLARARRPGPPTGRRGVVVRSVRLCRVGPTVAEGTAVVHDGNRVRAAAVRFEVHRGSWRATVLQIG